jgi:hypothetical protein
LSYVQRVAVPDSSADAPIGFEINYPQELVTGTSNFMEYSINNGKTWVAITSSELNIETLIPASTVTNDLTMQIRVKATTTEPASLATDLAIQRRPATPSENDVKFDGISETVLVDDTLEYRMGTTGDFTSVSDGETFIPVDVAEASHSYQIKVKATDTTFASAARTITVPARPAAPTAVYDIINDRITGVTTAMEFSLDDGETWTDCSGTILDRSIFGYEEIVVQLRIRATDKAPVSFVQDISVFSNPDAETLENEMPQDELMLSDEEEQTTEIDLPDDSEATAPEDEEPDTDDESDSAPSDDEQTDDDLKPSDDDGTEQLPDNPEPSNDTEENHLDNYDQEETENNEDSTGNNAENGL